MLFDIVEFYPSISEDLLKQAQEFAATYTAVTEKEVDSILHSRESLLFAGEKSWMKKDGNGMFDVTMGCFDGAEICELVGAFALAKITEEFASKDIGLYRNDGLAVLRGVPGCAAERQGKNITQVFRKLGLRITIEVNLRVVNFLNVTMDLTNNKYSPYRKPNDKPMYVHRMSDHPPTILNNLPKSISRRLSEMSSNKETFIQATDIYSSALQASGCGYNERLEYINNYVMDERARNKRTRKRQTIWYNPPFSKSVTTNVAQKFLRLVDRHFPKKSKLHKIFNRDTLKVSYSCMPNMSTLIKAHNNRMRRNETHQQAENNKGSECNCRNKENCPLDGKCQTRSIIYKATVVSGEEEREYTGLTDNAFKQRYANHMSIFRHVKNEKSTELAKHVWKLKRRNEKSNGPYSREPRRTPIPPNTAVLCLTETLSIMEANKDTTLNCRTELVSKCRHQNKFYLLRFALSVI